MQFKSLLKRVEVDQAVFTGIFTRGWQFISGPVTMLVITWKFTRELQGYYYTFGSVLALQVFIEMGLGNVLIQFASHEWSKLRVNNRGRIEGDNDALSRLISISKIAFLWYAIGGLIVIIGLSIGGYIFFQHSPKMQSGIVWIGPWLALCLTTGIMLALSPAWSLLIGCNQVKSVYRFRLISGILQSITVWVAMSLNAKLWTGSICTLTVILVTIIYLLKFHKGFIQSLFSDLEGPTVDWLKDMFPLQWRIAVSWISGYFFFSLFTPVLFKFHGPIIAGQMGMTWSLVSALGAVSTVWLETRMPVFGMLVAKKDYSMLDKVVLKCGAISFIVGLIGAGIIESAICFLTYIKHPLSLRFLSPLETGIFLCAMIIMNLSYPQSYYLRAHKKEPFMWLSVGSGVAVGLTTTIFGRFFSAKGIALGYLGVVACIVVPVGFIILFKCRSKWHAPNYCG